MDQSEAAVSAADVLPQLPADVAGDQPIMFYSSGFIDRSSDKRSDAAYLQAAIEDPATIVRGDLGIAG